MLIYIICNTGFETGIAILLLYGLGVTKNTKNAHTLLIRAFEKGDIRDTSFYLGYYYDQIVGDIKKAIYYHEISAKYGLLQSIHWLANKFFLMKKYDEAYIYAMKGANRGDYKCQLILGEMYHKGNYVKKNNSTAAYYWYISALQGYESSKICLSCLLAYEELDINIFNIVKKYFSTEIKNKEPLAMKIYDKLPKFAKLFNI